MAGSLIVDVPTTLAMLQAFDTCEDDCNLINNAIDTAISDLHGHWTGDAMSTYNNSMNTWLDGFSKIRQGLAELESSMNQFRVLTGNAESSNTSTGSHWAVS